MFVERLSTVQNKGRSEGWGTMGISEDESAISKVSMDKKSLNNYGSCVQNIGRRPPENF